MPTPDVRGSFRSLPEAERYFRQKVNLPTRRWDELWQGQHARAFVVAGATRDALLADLREAVDAAISRGETLADFRARFRDIVERHGWRGWTGDGTTAGFNWRTSVIYHTNLRTAYMAGRWETLKAFPYLKYHHNTVRNPREQHKAWDGKIIAADDPWWQTHYPPNGWGCRCTVTGVSAARLHAEGKTAPDPAPPPVEGEPPPEWAYHVGVADQGREIADPLLAKTLDSRWSELPGRPYHAYGRPDQVPVDAPRAMPLADAERSPEALHAAWRRLYGDSATLQDPSGAEVLLSPRVIEHWLEDPKRLDGRQKYLPLLRETIEAPFEIWANFARNARGQVGLRRYYVKTVRLEGRKALTLIAEVLPGGVWGSFDFFRGARPQPRSRQGLLVWGRPVE
ncbi:phage minor head protein [Vulcaniibacterium tengchongense]|uniref:SPP1 gp7 family putative phage head morphogenesis protein n=1 Tax=Vulcaniibacterium tengchongense TaxID=1273429 RepID=A0A3N4VGH9_9GAMM|nr:phage minor head protein [Vulcaniibacterium tengchongense]RPE81838.1 SPP1 gp7 family putative phage head morphogenesis protein [Vulcaniibacterium tengchongense]